MNNGKSIRVRMAERLMLRKLKGIRQGWNELPRERITRAYVAEFPGWGVCVVEWRGQAPNYTPTRRVSE